MCIRDSSVRRLVRIAPRVQARAREGGRRAGEPPVARGGFRGRSGRAPGGGPRGAAWEPPG
eukprot:2196132-Pyramimonas_sp.AAC.1